MSPITNRSFGQDFTSLFLLIFGTFAIWSFVGLILLPGDFSINSFMMLGFLLCSYGAIGSAMMTLVSIVCHRLATRFSAAFNLGEKRSKVIRLIIYVLLWAFLLTLFYQCLPSHMLNKFGYGTNSSTSLAKRLFKGFYILPVIIVLTGCFLFRGKQ